MNSDWHPHYDELLAWRYKQLMAYRSSADALRTAYDFYSTRPAQWITDWVDTVDPRNVAAGGRVHLPLVLFPRQVQLVNFLHACMTAQTGGLVEKSRDMGATWVACAYSVWLWLFRPGVSVGWGSRKSQLVDRIGDPDSIFEKMRMLIRSLPSEFRPRVWDGNLMKLVNQDNGSTIVGEGGDEIGRGGRSTLYIVDEAAHLEHPELIEASLSENTRCRIDVSSVNGVGNVFYRRREAGIDWTPGAQMQSNTTYVFIMDWRDNPLKNQEWYEQRRAKFESEGLLHVFRQEVDRDYAASQAGGVLERDWIISAIDAHKKIAGMFDGGYVAGLDIADEGGDRNALAVRKGVVLQSLDEWGERDTGRTARRTVETMTKFTPCRVMYDSCGIGAGVKAEINRLRDDSLLPSTVVFSAWDAGANPDRPDEKVISGDASSPLNKDNFQNLKAQGWWSLRRRFEKTHKAVQQGVRCDPSELISIASALPLLRRLEKELLQPTMSLSSTMKLLIDKAPDGARSPDLADAVMMCFHPVGQTWIRVNI